MSGKSYSQHERACMKRAVELRAEQYKKGDYSSAFGYYVKAAELGDVDAHYRLSLMYYLGKVLRRMGEEIYHLEEAAIGGHPTARCGLGCHEWRNGNTERAVKHLIIAASMGHDGSIKFLMMNFGGDLSAKMTLLLLSVHIRPL
ncbi:hypothetical protein QTG54_015712 [Skeletonema marinoi]|uniref:Uncharacterized protein n=1 Tax=Skeletonema marinoi TaxID=267567 RepID=A0AAD8XU71_9STRA|nr:hypothetical protein QTG54_015712 [Skeletonema marinoi]